MAKGRFVLSIDPETAAKLVGYNVEYLEVHHAIGTRHNSTARREALVTQFLSDRGGRNDQYKAGPMMGLGPGPTKGQALPKLKESDIQRQIKEYLQWHGWFVFKNHQSLGSYPGVADLTAIKRRTVWIEVKTLVGKQSEDQIKFQREIEEHDGEYILAGG